MTAAARRKTPVDIRRGMLAKIHIARKDMALDDATYRGLLLNVTGKESSKDCSHTQLNAVLAHFKSLGWKPKRKAPKRAGSRALADKYEAPKIRALWLSLYHLGEVSDPKESALAAFVQRMTKSRYQPEGAAALQFLDRDQANAVIKALRGWCDRVGFWQPDAEYHGKINDARAAAGLEMVSIGVSAKYRLIERQWELLRELGAFNQPVFADVSSFLNHVYGVTSPCWLHPATAIKANERLGAWVRKVKAEKSKTVSEEPGGES